MQRGAEDRPVYVRIQDHIRESIAAGKFGPGDRLPSEAELSARFRTTRATVARALRELAFARVISREIGRGTFVARRAVSVPFEPTQIQSFEEAVGLQQGRITYRVLDVRRASAPPSVAAGLRIVEGSEVLRLERLRIVADVPLSVVVRWMAVDLGRRISADSISRHSIHDILRDEIARPVVHTDGYIEAAAADQRLSGLLEIKPNAPVLIRRYTLSDQDREPLVFGESWFREEFQIAYRMPMTGPKA